MAAAILDTGPLVAFFDASERRHAWARKRIAELDAPLLTCEPVVVEAMHLLRRDSRAAGLMMRLLDNGAIRIAFRLAEHLRSVGKLLVKCGDTPMSLADACLVWMTEIHERCRILSLDSDFQVYRKHGKRSIDVILPD